jgi:hypothetical protein
MHHIIKSRAAQTAGAAAEAAVIARLLAEEHAVVEHAVVEHAVVEHAA